MLFIGEIIVMKTFVVCALLASLLLTVGCTNNDTIMREQLNAERKRKLRDGADQFDVQALTDSLEYRFSKGNYRVQGDTLAGFGVQTAGGYEVPFKGFIPFSAITMIKTEEFSLAKTILIFAIPSAAIGAFFYAWGVSAAN